MTNIPMKLFLVYALILISFNSIAQGDTNKIQGIVTAYDSPLSNVNISLKGTSTGVQTDTNGKYMIEARPRDVLVFSYVGMKTVEIIVEDVTKVLNIDMMPTVQELEEVTVQQRERKGQEALADNYGTKKSIIRTAYGYVDAEKAGYEMNYVDGSELSGSAVDIVSALIGKVPGLRRSEDGSVILRGGGSLGNPRPPIFEIDGVIFTQTPSFLDINNIDRVAVIPGLNGAIKYGNIAGGGVIVINTKGTKVIRQEGANQPYDQAKLRNNKFDKSMATSSLEREAPIYIRALEKANSAEQAFNTFEEQKRNYGSSTYFYLESLKYFFEKWKETPYAQKIKEEIKENFDDNPNALKALAYILEEQNKLPEALELYKEILKKRPRYAQSYRDLANSYVINEEYKKGLGLYARYQSFRKIDSIPPIEDGIDAIMDTETTNLMALKGKELNITDSDKIDGDVGGIRVLFEWNNSEAEFDLQFVNPESRYFIWSHTAEKETERIYDEKVKGYSSKQFLIDQVLQGVWKINLRYLGNKSYEPTYLKSTVYYDYGKPSQKEVVKVFALSEKNVNRELLSIVARNNYGNK